MNDPRPNAWDDVLPTVRGDRVIIRRKRPRDFERIPRYIEGDSPAGREALGWSEVYTEPETDDGKPPEFAGASSKAIGCMLFVLAGIMLGSVAVIVWNLLA